MADECDLDDFDILDGGDERVGTREDATTFTHSNSKLTSHNVVTAAMKLWMKNKKKDMDSLKFFTDRKTLQHKGKEMFKRLERWYIYHVLNKTFKRSPCDPCVRRRRIRMRDLPLSEVLLTSPATSPQIGAPR